MVKKINYSSIKVENINRLHSVSNIRVGKIRLDKNERADPHFNKFLQKLKKNITSDLISAYPEFYKVYTKLSKKFGVNRSNIVLTAGSDQSIKNTFELFYKKNKEVITTCPTFAMVDIYCKVFKTKQIKVGYDKDLNLKTQEIYRSINKNTCLIILANPNSPTGKQIKKKELIKIIKKAKEYNVKVLLDEAYHEFANYNLSSKIKIYNNLIIIRTFSKIYGLAGLRAGYILSNKNIIRKFFAIKPMYEINSLAVKALELILDNPKFIKSYLKEMREGEAYARQFCMKNNFIFVKCDANFFHINFKHNPKNIQKYLFKKNILVKDSSGVDTFENYLRISFAKKSTISKMLNEIKKYLKNKK